MEKTEGARLTWADAKVWTARVEDGPYQLGFLLAPEGAGWRLSVFESNAGSRAPRQISVLSPELRKAQEFAQELTDKWLVDWSWLEVQSAVAAFERREADFRHVMTGGLQQ